MDLRSEDQDQSSGVSKNRKAICWSSCGSVDLCRQEVLPHFAFLAISNHMRNLGTLLPPTVFYLPDLLLI